MTDKRPSAEARRVFFKQAAQSALPLVGLMSAPAAAAGAPQVASMPSTSGAVTSPPPTGYMSLGKDEAAFVEALVNVMCPADAMTPDGVACGLASFIDRQLAGAFGKGAKLYDHGPWLVGKPEHGYQLPMTPEQHFKAGVAIVDDVCQTRWQKRFERLPATVADSFLTELAAGRVTDDRLPLVAWFNELVYPLFAQGCYADPIYGGNADKVFWKMIGYPGLPATHTVDMVRYRGLPYPGATAPRSIVDFS
jgi:gluconate 2-dehydrogenase gamma chain